MTASERTGPAAMASGGPSETSVERIQVALAPGTLVHFGRRRCDEVQLRVLRFDEKALAERRVDDVDAALALRGGGVTWINVDGLHEVATVGRLCDALGIHPLHQEDILNTHQRPKLEEHEGYLFVVLKMVRYDTVARALVDEQVSLVLLDGCVLSFQEEPGDVFDRVRARARAGIGRLRRSGADYLMYALIDAVVDHYFVVLEDLASDIDRLEDAVIAGPNQTVLAELHQRGREAAELRRVVWPLREVIHRLERTEAEVVSSATRLYLRDVYDHVVHVIEVSEGFRETLSGLLSLYLSTIGNRTNDIMKVLTIIATIFMPLSFLAGVYGMNFDPNASRWNMPELGWRYGYPAVLVLMAAAAGAMLLFFRRRGWL